MSHSIYHNSKTDRQYRAATGLSLVEFDVLYDAFALFYTPKSPGPYPGMSAPVLTNKREALFFILHYYKAYPTFQNLGLYFGISDATACIYLERLKPCLRMSLNRQNVTITRIFKNQAEFDRLFEGVEDIMIDVTEVPIERSDSYEVQKSQYSGKKKHHTVKWLLISNRHRQILFASTWYDGRVHDFSIFKEIFTAIDFSSLRIHVDLGFLGIRKVVKGGEVFMPHKSRKNAPLSLEQKDENTVLSRTRVVVENSIAKMKSFFVLRIENRMKMKIKLDEAFEICAALANFKTKILLTDRA